MVFDPFFRFRFLVVIIAIYIVNGLSRHPDENGGGESAVGGELCLFQLLFNVFADFTRLVLVGMNVFDKFPVELNRSEIETSQSLRFTA